MKANVCLRFASFAVLLMGLAGCKSLFKKRVPVTEPSASATVAVPPPPLASVSAVASAPVAALVADEDAVPAPEDFEDEAFEKVTAANFKAELARLQKEVGTK